MNLTVAPRNVVFNGTQRYITPRMYSDLKSILTKMNSEAKYVDNGNSFDTSTITKLILKNKPDTILTDRRFYTSPRPDEQQMEYVTQIDMGRTKLVIANSSGEIISYKKPFFKSWTKIMNQLNMVLRGFDSFYSVDKIVEKVKFSIHGLTEKGIELLNNAAKGNKK